MEVAIKNVLLPVVAIGCLCGTFAVAQNSEIRPLYEYLQLSKDRKNVSYPFVRCTGLFRGIFRYGGASFSEEEARQTQSATESMTTVAFRLRSNQNSDISPDDTALQIASEIEAIEMVYADRMRQNFAHTGEAWGADETILSDLEICGRISQIAVNALNR